MSLPPYEQLNKYFPPDQMTAEEQAQIIPPLVKIIVDCDPVDIEASENFRTCLEELIEQIVAVSNGIKDKEKLIEYLLKIPYQKAQENKP